MINGLSPVRSTIVPFERKQRSRGGRGVRARQNLKYRGSASYSYISEKLVTCPIATEIFQGEMPSLRIFPKENASFSFFRAGWKHDTRSAKKKKNISYASHICILCVCVCVYTCACIVEISCRVPLSPRVTWNFA